jgi:hypothetical protein
LSSTTDRSSQQGQVLVLFAGAVVTLVIVAALAFDVGAMVLERRDQQNAADAAALAGARYVLDAATGTTDCASVSGPAPAANDPAAAVWAACNVAKTNDSWDDETVVVHIPPLHGEFQGFPGFLEVQIESSRDSIFGGVIGRSTWPVGVMAVAANQPGVTYTFGMLALNPTECKAIHISGTGTVNSAGNVWANSTGEDCGDGSNIGLSRTGAGVLNVTAPDAVCSSGGEIQDQGSGTMTCAPDEFSFALPDPLRDLEAPAKPALAAPMKEWDPDPLPGVVIEFPPNVPGDCPGAVSPKEPSEASPQLCTLGLGPDQQDRYWILSPGLYPGGLELKGGVTAYLLPGIYWIGGGGFTTSNDASLISVESEADLTPAICTVDTDPLTPPCVGGGGVLIYNTTLPGSPAGPVSLGGGGATLKLQPFDYPFGDTTIELVLFQDRTVSLGGYDITLNGSSAQATEVRGIIYAPEGDVRVNGSSSVFTMDQVIANTFLIDGNGGTVNILRETGVDAVISAVGLVE